MFKEPFVPKWMDGWAEEGWMNGCVGGWIFWGGKLDGERCSHQYSLFLLRIVHNSHFQYFKKLSTGELMYIMVDKNKTLKLCVENDRLGKVDIHICKY
jgi:hypothetical protein